MSKINFQNLNLPKIYLDITIDQKDEVKAMGAKWCSPIKKWYVYDCDENEEIINKFTKIKYVKKATKQPLHFLIRIKMKDGKHKVIDSKTKEIKIVDKLPPDISKFIVMQQNDSDVTDEFLTEYLDRFNNWCDEIQGHIIPDFDYRDSISDYGAVARVFNYFCKKHYGNHEPISPIEYQYFEACHNGGVQFISKECVGKTIESFGYDYRSFYAQILKSSLMIPTKAGKEYMLTELPKRKDLKHGFYRVKITCDNDKFRAIFGFSHANTYLNINLAFAMKHKKEFGVNIELIQDDKPNAYLYETCDMVEMRSICENWFNKLDKIKNMFPKNKLVKHLISSAWGHMNAKHATFKTFEEMEEMRKNGVTIGMKDNNDYKIIGHEDNRNDVDYYELLDCKEPYAYNIRLKPFVTGYGRNEIAEIALCSIENVVRVHTDSVVFDCQMTFTDSTLISEDKTTGLIKWKHCNSYKKV